jgi:hypothetical protein
MASKWLGHWRNISITPEEMKGYIVTRAWNRFRKPIYWVLTLRSGNERDMRESANSANSGNSDIHWCELVMKQIQSRRELIYCQKISQTDLFILFRSCSTQFPRMCFTHTIDLCSPHISISDIDPCRIPHCNNNNQKQKEHIFMKKQL